MDDAIGFGGRIPYPSQTPSVLRAVVEGHDVTSAGAGTLHAGVSSEDVTPATGTLAGHAIPGRCSCATLLAGGERPVAGNAVLEGVPGVTFAGKRDDERSSPEHGVDVELRAGIRLVEKQW